MFGREEIYGFYLISRVCFVGFETGKIGVGWKDNVYTLCYSEVVSPGCDDASLVSYSANRFVGSLPATAAGFSLRDYLAEAGLCFCASGYSLLVRDFDAAAVGLESEKKRAAKGEEEV